MLPSKAKIEQKPKLHIPSQPKQQSSAKIQVNKGIHLEDQEPTNMDCTDESGTTTNQQATGISLQNSEKKNSAFYSPRLVAGGQSKIISLPIEEENNIQEDRKASEFKKDEGSRDTKKGKIEEKKESSQTKQATGGSLKPNASISSNQQGLKKPQGSCKFPPAPTKHHISKNDLKTIQQAEVNMKQSQGDSQNNSTTNVINQSQQQQQQTYSKQNSQTNKNSSTSKNEPAALYNAKGNIQLCSGSLVQPTIQLNKESSLMSGGSLPRQSTMLKASPPGSQQKGEKQSQNRQSLNATPNSNTKTTSDEKTQEINTQLGFSNIHDEKMGCGKKMGDQDDDFIEDFLDDSMELQESNTVIGLSHKGGTARKIDASRLGKSEKLNDNNNSMTESKEGSNGVGGRVQMQQYSNKIYQTSPSKLNQKFQVTLQGQSKNSTQHIQSSTTQQQVQKQSVQQNPKASATTGKKSIQSLQEPSKPVGLIDLNLSMTNLQRLAPEQVSNQNIRSLDIRSNRITQLPHEVFDLVNLWKLQLDNNQITELPDLFSNLKGLKFFTVSSNSLSEIPSSLFDAFSLERLDLSVNQITRISGQIFKLQKLKYLYIQDNFITEVPLNISQLKNLTQFGLEWFQYLRQNGEKIIKKPESLISQIGKQQNQKGSHDKLDSHNQESRQFDQVMSIFQKLNQSLIGKDIEILQQQEIQVSFIDFLRYYYKAENLMDLLNSHFVYKNTTILHLLCKFNHYCLYDSVVNPSQNYENSPVKSNNMEYVDVNLQNENNETPLMLALNEKSMNMIERLLRDFGNQIDFEDAGNSHYFTYDMDKSVSQSPQKLYFMSQAQHPLMIAIKKQMFDIAIQILGLMLKKQAKVKAGPFLIDLNLKDEQRNTMIHHLFQYFSTNMEMTVELLQELMKLGEKYLSQEGGISLNEVNKLGQTPIDIAVELKQKQENFFNQFVFSQALEFAIYYNKNLLPALNSPSIQDKSNGGGGSSSNQTLNTVATKSLFNLNSNKNQRGLTPIHRAILNQNYKAIYLLLSSGDCDLFIKDKEFKTPRDYCQRVMFLSKYIRKGEYNFLRSTLYKRGALRFIGGPTPKDIKLYVLVYQQCLLIECDEQNSDSQQSQFVLIDWYTRLEQRNMLSSSQQPTIEKQRDGLQTEEGMMDLEEVKLEDMKDEPENEDDDGVAQVEMVDKDDDDDDDFSQIDVIDEDEEGKLEMIKNKTSLINEMVVSVKSSVLEVKAKDSSSKLQQGIPSFISSSALLSNQKINGKNTVTKKASTGSATGKQDSRIGFQNKRESVSGSKSKDNTNPNTKNSFNTSKDQQKNQKKNPSPNTKDDPFKPRPSTITPLTLGVKDVDSSMSEIVRVSQLKEHEVKKGATAAAGMKGKAQQQKHQQEDDEDEFSDVENEEKECPASLLSMSNQYVMVANSSKLSRKPYYKQLQKNKFEREFCYLLDSKICIWERLKKLYQFYIEVQSSSDCYLTDLRDARDMLRFLKLELEGKEGALIQSFKFEIQYMLERMQSQLEKPGMGVNLNNQAVRKNTNYSQERNQLLPLPSIQEISCEKIGNVVNSRSLLKKNSNSSNGATQLQNDINQANNNRGRIQSNYNTPAASNQKSSQQKSGNKQGTGSGGGVNTQVVEQTNNLKLNNNSSQKSLEGFQSQKQTINSNSTNGQTKHPINLNQNYGLKSKNTAQSSRNNNAFASQNQQMKQQAETGSNTREQQQPTSPRATSSQIQSKAQGNQIVSTLNEQRNSISQQNAKSKDACIKKIEVKLKEPTLIQTPSQSSQQSQHSEQPTQQKWKQLTINPNAPPSNISGQNSSKIPTTGMSNNGGTGSSGVSLSVGKQIQKPSTTNSSSNYNSNQHKVSTPQSQKISSNGNAGTPSNSSSAANSITVNVIGGSAKSNIRSINNSNLNGAGLIQQQQTKQGSSLIGGGTKSDSQQNRSNSNPRSSILNANTTLSKQGGGTSSSSNAQSVGGQSQIQLQSFDSSNQQQQEAVQTQNKYTPYSSSNGSVISTSNMKSNASAQKTVVLQMQSKLKGPTKIGGVSIGGKQNNVSKTSK